ncbi:hypothetical protein Nepgr_027939 [Nepenthes gracilis]|uniref:Alliinase C-terminal domain-containing protein n=1 Tax=Nepenthes gracilis TaxID=150966 RepID=A0AAD3TBF6_NEPGR|nr:hypothetical protein Nepgr_027939 [Nepenthes gracilis]
MGGMKGNEEGKSSSSATGDFSKEKTIGSLFNESMINLDHGDPKVFEAYWVEMDAESSITITASQSLSYFSDITNLCWFLQPELANAIRSLHGVVGNAVAGDRYIVVGNGSSQVFQAALYALSSDSDEPINVVSAAPYYSSYPPMADLVKSRLYHWGGDANVFDDKDRPYIEVVCSPCNPDGSIRKQVINGPDGKLIYDLAYYWPQFTPITFQADHDIMMFTASKSTGHAGSRIGWAIVKEECIARKMTEFIELNTIGVSKEAQLRVAKILDFIYDGCRKSESDEPPQSNVFEYGHRILSERWKKLREVVDRTKVFNLAEYPSEHCNFFGKVTKSHPGNERYIMGNI